MSIYELDAKVAELKELRNLEAEVKAEITSIEDEIKSEMLAKNVEVLQGQSCKITWKTITTTRFDSAALSSPTQICFSSTARPPPAADW